MKPKPGGEGMFDWAGGTEPARIGFVGVPYEQAEGGGRPGSADAPGAIRHASRLLDTYSPLVELDLHEAGARDEGDLTWSNREGIGMEQSVVACVTQQLEAARVPILLGGDNVCAVPAVTAMLAKYPDLMILQLDAHANLALVSPDVSVQRTTMTRIREILPDAQRTVIYGVRAGQRDEIERARQCRVCGPFPSFDHQRLTALRYHLEAVHFRPIFVLCDLDVFDPSVVPGVRYPEPGGIDYEEFRQMLYHLKGRHIAGAAVVGASLRQDVAETSAVVAAKVARELGLLGALWHLRSSSQRSVGQT